MSAAEAWPEDPWAAEASVSTTATTAVAAEWLHQLYGTAEEGWLSLFTLDRTTGRRGVDWARVDDPQAILDAAARREPTCCVWLGAATRHQRLEGGRRGGIEDCAAIPGLWLDVDVAGPGHASDARLAPDRATAHALVERFPLAPTAVIDSGGGLQAWWLFAEMLTLDDDTLRLLDAWGATWQRLADDLDLDVDNVFEAARVMRLPGTTNRKADLARPVVLVEHDWARRYGVDDLEQHLDAPPAPPEPATGGRLNSYAGPERPGTAYNARHSGGEVLQRAGFTLGHRDRNGDEHWVRPGKLARDGTSATVYAEDGHTTIWSDTCAAQWPGLELRRPYDPFGLYTHLEHQGNFTAARAALEAQGYGEAPERIRLADYMVGAGEREPTAASPLHLPDDFWSASEVLTHIRSAAHARVRPADAVLGAVLARVTAATGPSLCLPAIVGTRGSLNLMVALVGPSGAGKSSSVALGRELVALEAPDFLDDVPIGSGEGLIDMYFELVEDKNEDAKKGSKVKRQTKTRALVYIDEGQVLGEMGARRGTTVMPMLRSAWSGATLGQANASVETRRRLDAGSYRLSAVVGFQPEHGANLLADAAGGTPQRFLWLSATDPAIPDEPPAWPGPVEWTPPPSRAYAGATFVHDLQVPDEVAAEVRANQLAQARGALVDSLDAHQDLGRLKVAAALALLHQRDEAMSAEDWRLAGVVMATSRAVRTAVADHARREEARREEATHARAARREAVIDDTAEARALRKASAAIGRKAHRGSCTCDGAHTRRCLQRAPASRDLKLVTADDALEVAVAEGWVVPTSDDTYRPGDTRPA